MEVSRACRLSMISRALWYYRSRQPPQTALAMRIRELAHARPRYGARRVHVLLRREGWTVNHKRVRRLYRLEGLQLRHRTRRRKHISLHRGVVQPATRAHERWSLEFVHDALSDGRAFRVLTVIDQWSRWSPILEVAQSMSGAGVSPRPSTGPSPSTAVLRQSPLITGRSSPRVPLTSGRIVAA